MLDRRRLLQSAAAGAGLAALGDAAFAQVMAPATNAAGETLRAFMDKAFEETLDLSPETVTAFGLDKGARAAAKSKLTIPTRAEEEGQRAFFRAQRAQLAGMNRSAMQAQDGLYYDSLTANLDAVIATFDIPYGQGGWPNPYRVSQQGGTYQSAPDFLGNQHTIETAADADAYVARVRVLSDVFRAETDRLKEEYALGVVPPDFILAKAVRQQEGMLATAASASPITRSVIDRAQAKGLSGNWGAEVERLLTEQVYPALAAQNAVLKAALPGATHEASVRRLPQGDQYYANSLHYITTTRLTADEIHRTGLEQMANLTGRADVLLKAQGLTQGSVAERIKALGDDPKYVYPNTDAGKAELIAKLNAQMADMQGRLPRAFGRLPKAPVEIKRVPPEIEAGAPMGYYNSASLDGTRPGIYWINLKDTSEWPSWSLPTLTYHEASPGHHLQISLQQESPSAPMLMNLLGFSSYVEGWGLYAEQLADELGAYEHDPLGQIGYLQSLMFRSARLVVDTGIHSKGWSREQGIRYMMEAYGDQEGAATSEVERYCGWPGQACAYKVGHNEWVRLREKAKTALGPRFDIKGFHDTALAAGGVPLSVLERIVDGWVATQA
ncbi:uncharacterized protein (DUF885 family) [Brevundimonas nasdae]|uniref:DUF885 domain-containing protein n=1 Tax=Brevundimonas nasdae TaxID=172043 RepID=UPI001914CF12|nr:DUF885 family protein [Brevundimonas nasdae]MBK6026492.1 DUF885 family protein [Brevundimonas nasdae]MDQ0453153.1 uncharacterized protein (DUF885 family) [Brevundimonas nasdae]